MKKYLVLIGNITLGFLLFFVLMISSNILIMNLLPHLKGSFLYITPINFMVSTWIMGKLTIGKKRWEGSWKAEKKIRKFLIGAVVSSIIVSLGSVAILMTGTVVIQENIWSYNNMFLQLMMLLMVAIGEEMFFRGFIYDISKEVVNDIGIIMINAIIFAGVHLLNEGATEQPFEFIVVGMINIILITVIFTQARIYSKSLWMPIGLHFLFNVTQSCIFGYVNGGKVAVSLFKMTYLEQSLLNGGLFGMEASLMLSPILTITIIVFGVIGHNREKRNFRTTGGN